MSGSGKWPAARHTESLWRARNRVQLLENGEEFFPRAFAAISRAQHEILIETFILFEDKVGLELHRLLVEAAQRGVRVEVTVDGYGSPGFSPNVRYESSASWEPGVCGEVVWTRRCRSSRRK